MRKPLGIQQVTRGHNIDGWAGASNPNPYPKSPSRKHNKSSKDRTWPAVPDALPGVIS